MTTSYQTPGVYVNEITPAPGPIQGASTSVAAFVGATVSGPDVGTVSAVTNFTSFKNLFALDDEGTLPEDNGFVCLANAVYGFFNNGGNRCYVTRIVSVDVKTDVVAAMTSAATGYTPSTGDAMTGDDAAKVIAAIPGEIKADLLASATAKDVVKARRARALERNVKSVVKADAQTAVAAAVASVMTSWSADDAGAAASAMLSAAKTAYADDMKTTSSTDISDALVLLEAFDDISIVAAPGLSGRTVWGNLQDHCTNNAPNRFAILDAPADADWATSEPTGLPDANSSSAIYYPWLQVSDPVTRTIRAVPPSGHVAGIYARVDAQRGVFKAPANEPVLGALDLTALVTDRQQAPLNDDGTCVNCIRRLNGNILVWGARTAGWSNASPLADAPFKYLSTRRTYNYIRLSLQQGTQWAVFEPNTQVLWGKIVRNVTSFLTKLWQSGGLFGATAAEAFYVKCDEETNPPDNRRNGMVTTEVGVAITQPAEFVVFNLGVMTGDASASS